MSTFLAAAAASPPEEVCSFEKSWKVVSWNVAAINNNPFEYYMDHPDPRYLELMSGVERFISNPGALDVTVGSVFTDAMEQELQEKMRSATPWDEVDATHAYWLSELRDRKIVSGFLLDGSLGDKRLFSMPDRATNTIGLEQGVACRPTVINMYEGDLSSVATWWPLWKRWFFEEQLPMAGKKKKPFELLRPLNSEKYPAVTEEEQRISLPLQALCQSVFDAVLVHMLSVLSPDGSWLLLKEGICAALSRNKIQRTAELLLPASSNNNAVIAVQEASKRTLADLLKKKDFQYVLFAPEDPAALDRDQASALLLNRHAVDVETAVEVTEDALCKFDVDILAPGDLFVLRVQRLDGEQLLIASFHGDTDGLATIPVLEALASLAIDLDLGLLLLLDANAHTTERATPGKKLGWRELINATERLGLATCFDGQQPPLSTFNARTYLQPQTQKAIPISEMATSLKSDRNPKDYVIFSKSLVAGVQDTSLDNTGNGVYDDKPFPTLNFPSDHGILRTTINFR